MILNNGKEVNNIINILTVKVEEMVEEIKAKRVPWSHLEKYLATHKAAIVTYLD